jgi:threonine/homoserine/homoserine lactone efflux protein
MIGGLDFAFIPDQRVILDYTFACLILFITPGPDMSLFLAKTMAGGRKAGIASMLGASVGCCIHSVLAAIGLSALIAASATAFTVLKAAGAAYLLWLAWQAIRHGSTLTVSGAVTAPPGFWKTFLLGMTVNLSNPKVVLFFIAFLPLFISAGDPDATGKLLFLGLYFVAVSIPLGVLMILGAERMVSMLKRNPRVLRAVDYLFAGVFGYFAVMIMKTQARG